MKNQLFYILPALLFFSCSEKKETFSTQQKTVIASVYASGLVKAKNQFTVYATTTGILKKIHYKPGDTVAIHQTIFEIDNTNAQLNRANAQENLALTQASRADKIQEIELILKAAKEKLALDESVYQRQKRLWEQKIGSELEFEQKKLNYTTAQINYDNARNKLSQLKNNLDTDYKRNTNSLNISDKNVQDYIIKSPFSGRLFDVLVKEGMLVTPQIPLAIIGNTNSYYLELEIDENDLLKIENGQQVMVSMDSYKGQVFEALITQINPLMNERNRTFTVEAQFKNAPQKMYPNLTVEANIIIATKKNTLTIPKNYLLKGDSVWINETTKRKIKLGISDYENVEVLSGLRKNELIYKP